MLLSILGEAILGVLFIVLGMILIIQAFDHLTGGLPW